MVYRWVFYLELERRVRADRPEGGQVNVSSGCYDGRERLKMGTSSRIATLLDAEMLLANHVTIYPHSVRWSQIEEEQGARGIDVLAQLGLRYLIHYIRRRDVGRFARGRGGRV